MIEASQPPRNPPRRLALVMSDVDGSLVTADKRLTPATIAAAQALRDRGVRFTVASSRPPFGLKSVVEELGVDLPFAAFNGGLLVRRDGQTLAAHWIAREVAAAAIRFFQDWRFDVWAFTAQEWLCRDAEGPYVAHETRTVSQSPTLTDTFDAVLDRLGKIVAVSKDAERLAQCEAAAQKRFGSKAVVARSQAYYLDVTHPAANKAEALRTIASSLGVGPSDCAAIGDGANDLGMLRAAGYGIAMGNGVEALRAQSDFVTASNEEDGFARAVEHLLKETEA